MLRKSLDFLRGHCTSANNSHYVSTPIFYVNAAPHIGHLYTALIADAICRYQKLQLNPSNAVSVRLSTGTDEHGMKVQQAASLQNIPLMEYCTKVSSQYCNVFKEATIDYTDFIRTTEDRHKESVAAFWQQLKSNGSIYLSQYNGWYCLADETFLNETQTHLNKSTGCRTSIESGHTVEWTEEENYMFELSKYKGDILYWLKQGGRIKPLKFEKILLDMLEESLPDVSVSRPAYRVHWAIPVPEDSTQTVYVWLDALVNYLTALGYPNPKFRKWWPPKTQVIGKDILKFHGIYWPAFLLAAGLEPPKQLMVHSHWTIDEQKMSKSKKNVVDPVKIAEFCSMEGLRYFLLRSGVAHSDGNYNSIKLMRILNAELADTLGNLLSRVCSKAINPQQIYPRLHLSQLRDILTTDVGKGLRDAVIQLKDKCTAHYNEYNFYLAVDVIISTLHQANSFFEFSRPWELLLKCNGTHSKRNDMPMPIPQYNENTLKLETIIAMTMDTLRVCGIALQPIVPQLSTHLLDKLGVPNTERMWKCMDNNFVEIAEGKREPPFEISLHRNNPVLFTRLVVKNEMEIGLELNH